MNSFLKELQEKNLIQDISNIEKIENSLKNKMGIYVGFDPSAKSIHLGNFVVINVLLIAKKHRIPTVALIGGATGGIGDPSGKKSERILIDEDTLKKNTEAIKKQIKHFLPDAKIVNNSDFYKNQSFIDFLRDVGKFIQVSYMLSKEIVKNRLESGISFTEFAYSLIQANDFHYLFKNHNVGIQFGGSDQWGNITTGLELIRKRNGENSFSGGFTIKLLLKSDGTKFGKSEQGAIYLDPSLTSPYTMYQFLLNQNDSDLLNLFNFISDLGIKEILEIITKHSENPEKRYGQKMLANNIVNRIHGKNALNEVENISNILFKNGKINDLSKSEVSIIINSFEVNHVNFSNDEKIIDILDRAKIFKSKNEIRKLIEQKGLVVGAEIITDFDQILKDSNLTHGVIFARQGKKKIFIIKKS
ncbi:tyrosine--tRNA ligase [[Mycoplasma] mobile]|uniref:Tyrosine--tRNA ligase n=1 Tax=Mycoplasma mobile (strain ATCC 43663 / 163K / NCTC 11711) TaxID=267748 RepID=SYY_MYCM1|nr:tyrosine--tRNA ligase [[Mycoplasma] mobile]Q6KH97.1 RecName: Full=Tyrosine--tRNA ligase; AltName: Full=Tyrosyl-tRNA synthetase; Short=TyrRS [Mycoplasma mobile 163K]AAT28033.1 tyrosyl-tRNA synthetase [Mycoplasma mobile 163K]